MRTGARQMLATALQAEVLPPLYLHGLSFSDFGPESESWAELLSSCRRRGMRAPGRAVADGALGFWEALRDVFADTNEQQCWWHKIVICRCAVAPRVVAP